MSEQTKGKAAGPSREAGATRSPPARKDKQKASEGKEKPQTQPKNFCEQMRNAQRRRMR